MNRYYNLLYSYCYFSLCVNIILHVFMFVVTVSFDFPNVPVLCLLLAFLLLCQHIGAPKAGLNPSELPPPPSKG